jgi:catechol 2,3-dioxygenase-like lactoylglutathione lyase family enzyme
MEFRPGEINIICSNLDRSVAFYTEVLDFQMLEREEPFAHLMCGAQSFLLLAVTNPKDAPPYCSEPTISVDLYVDDIDAAVAHFEEMQVTIAREYDPEQKSIFIRDPDGLVFEVIEAREE